MVGPSPAATTRRSISEKDYPPATQSHIWKGFLRNTQQTSLKKIMLCIVCLAMGAQSTSVRLTKKLNRICEFFRRATNNLFSGNFNCF